MKPMNAIIVLSLVVASLLVAGCTTSTSPTAAPTVKATVAATATVKATATPAPTKAAQPSATRFVTVIVNSRTTSNQLGTYPLQSTPSAGRTFAVFDVTVTNQNKNNLYMGNPLYFTLKTGDGTVYQYSTSSYYLQPEITGVFNTNPGDKVTGQIAFEIPQSAKPTQLLYGDLINGVVTVNL
jgi:Domain of unknown function (DUF4352)